MGSRSLVHQQHPQISPQRRDRDTCALQLQDLEELQKDQTDDMFLFSPS
jgi:hypothetical protein